MRLTILDRGRGFATKTLFMVIRVMPRQPVLDVIKLVRYRADFLRQASNPSGNARALHVVGDRELLVTLVTTTNRCDCCRKAHTAVAEAAAVLQKALCAHGYARRAAVAQPGVPSREIRSGA